MQEKSEKEKEKMLKDVPTAGKGPLGYGSDWNTCDFKNEKRTIKMILVLLVLFVMCLVLASGW